MLGGTFLHGGRLFCVKISRRFLFFLCVCVCRLSLNESAIYVQRLCSIKKKERKKERNAIEKDDGREWLAAPSAGRKTRDHVIMWIMIPLSCLFCRLILFERFYRFLLGVSFWSRERRGIVKINATLPSCFIFRKHSNQMWNPFRGTYGWYYSLLYTAYSFRAI